MIIRNEAELEYFECIELSEKAEDLNFLINRLESNYLLLNSITSKYCNNKDDEAYVSLISCLFRDNIKKVYTLLKK